MSHRTITFILADSPPPRLDKALARDVPEQAALSRTRLSRLIEQGAVRVDGQVVQQLGSRVSPQQRIELDAPRMSLDGLSISLLLHRAADSRLPLAGLTRRIGAAAAEGSGLCGACRACLWVWACVTCELCACV